MATPAPGVVGSLQQLKKVSASSVIWYVVPRTSPAINWLPSGTGPGPSFKTSAGVGFPPVVSQKLAKPPKFQPAQSLSKVPFVTSPANAGLAQRMQARNRIDFIFTLQS